MARRRGKRRSGNRWLLALLLVGALAAAAYFARDALVPPAQEPPRPLPSGTLRVHYVDVGQGDAVVWELPGGGLVVYDCGDVASSPEANPLVRYLRDVLKRPSGSVIDAFVASHGHRDHVGGCDELFQEYEVREVYEGWYDGPGRPASYLRFLDLLRAEGSRVHTVPQPNETADPDAFGQWDPLPLPEGANATARFFWPPALAASSWDAIAESSLGVRLSFGEVSFCFQGDIETAQESRLAAADAAQDLSCDVYLVGHHGSREASSEAWLRRMDPEVAVVSFGDNPYGHPTSAALCRVQQAGAKVYATHRAGTVTLETDGREVRVLGGAPETKDYCAAGASYWDA